MAIDIEALIRLSGDELIALWSQQEPADEGTNAEQDVLAAEIERRGLDL